MAYTKKLVVPGWQSGQFSSVRSGGSSNAAGSRPVVPFRDAWVQISRPDLQTCYENPNPGAEYYKIPEVRRKADYYGQISRGRETNFESQDLYAL